MVVVTPPAGQLTGALTGAAPILTYTAPTTPTDRHLRLQGQRRRARGAGDDHHHRHCGRTSPPWPTTTRRTTTQETPVVIDVLDGDTDADGDTLIVNGYTNGSQRLGDLQRRPTCTYTPRARASSERTRSRTRSYDGFGGQRRRHGHRHRRSVADRREPRPGSTPTTGPGATVDQPRRHPLRAHARARRRRLERAVRPSVRRSSERCAVRPTRSPFVEALAGRRVRAVRPSVRRSSSVRRCRRSPSTIPAVGQRCSSGRRSPASRRRASRSDEFLALYEPPGPPTQALRDLTLEDVSFFDGTPARRMQARPRSCSARRRSSDLQLRDPDMVRAAGGRHGARRRARCSASTSHDDDARARRRPRSGQGPRAAPRPPPRAARGQLRRVRRCPADRRPAQRAQPVRHRRSVRSPWPLRSPRRLPSARCASPTSRSTTRILTTAHTDGAISSSTARGGFDCSGGATLGRSRSPPAHSSPGAKLQDVGRAFVDHTVAGDPADHARPDRRCAARRHSTSTT